MGKDKQFRPTFPVYGEARQLQALTGDSTGTAITREGITTIALTTGEGTGVATLNFAVDNPEVVGMEKKVLVYVTGASTKDIVLQTGANLYGTTGMTVIVNSSAVADLGRPQVIDLVGQSTAAWALLNLPSTEAQGATLTFGT